MSDTTSSQRLNLSLDMRLVSAALLAVIVVMLFVWKPWSGPAATNRTVEVTGEATVTAKPDEFVFYPSYQFKDADKSAALDELSKKSDEIVAKLKDLGVPESKIKTNSSGYDYPVYSDVDSKDVTYTLQLTVTTSNLDQTQKVQDYLVTTSPAGSVSPQASFSDKKRKELENNARDEATKDARKKVEQMADNLDFRIGKVKAISDNSGFGGGIIPYATRGEAMATDSAKSSLPVQPGENDLDYSVTVTYFIK